MHDIVEGRIQVFGRTWDERSVVDLEEGRSSIGTVVNPRSKASANWLTSLDVDENVTLSAEFDRKRSHASIMKKAANFAKQFALDEDHQLISSIDCGCCGAADERCCSAQI